jgi:hypothetical protein
MYTEIEKGTVWEESGKRQVLVSCRFVLACYHPLQFWWIGCFLYAIAQSKSSCLNIQKVWEWKISVWIKVIFSWSVLEILIPAHAYFNSVQAHSWNFTFIFWILWQILMRYCIQYLMSCYTCTMFKVHSFNSF